MRLHRLCFPFTLLLAACSALGQGTFVYDQQSSTNEAFSAATEVIQQVPQPFGQSFMPALASVGFIRLQFGDLEPGNGRGASVYVNLRADSLTGPILASTTLVALPDRFMGATNLYFAIPVPVTPEVTYYFDPRVQSGDLCAITGRGDLGYPRGNLFIGGSAIEYADLWFREGIVVPEPSAAWLVFLGSGVLVHARHRQIKKRFVA
jgi:hypothetical protein